MRLDKTDPGDRMLAEWLLRQDGMREAIERALRSLAEVAEEMSKRLEEFERERTWSQKTTPPGPTAGPPRPRRPPRHVRPTASRRARNVNRGRHGKRFRERRAPPRNHKTD